MSPLAVLQTLWSHKFITLPVLLVTLIAGVYVFQFAPRSYDTTMTYALINPTIPSQEQILKDPKYAKLNDNNPYLRASDRSLIVQVLIAKLTDPSIVKGVMSQGLSGEYTVAQSISGQNSFLIDIVGTGSTPEEAFAIARAVGQELEKKLYSLQTIYGASDEYTYTSLVVVSPDQAFEQFSSRLRSLVVVLLGGSVLLFGAVSVARALDRTSAKKRETVDAAGGTGFGAGNLTDSELPLDLGGRIDISTARRTSGLMVKVGRGAEDRSPLANRSTASGEVEGE